MSVPTVVVAGSSHIKPEELHHHALEQLPGLAYCINDNPNWGVAIVLGFQHYLTMLGTAVLIPLLIIRAIGGEAGDLARTVQSVLFVSAINTLVQTYLGSRLPVVMGNSFYFLTITLAIVNRPGIIDNPDPHQRFLLGMRATQGAFIAGSAINIILGFSGLWGIAARYISPVVIAPVTTLVGLGLFERGFPGVAKCVEVGIPALLIILLFSQFLKHHHFREHHFFELYPIIIGVVIVWVYATILTVAGAYDHASALGQIHCRTDRAGIVSTAPWVRIPYPLQWGAPTFDAGDAFGVMAAAFAALVESTGGFYAVSRLAGATPPPPYVISRGIGWQGIGLLLNGFWGTFTGTTVAPENVGLVGLTRVGSRRVVQISAAFMLFFSIFGKFGGVLASIPQPIVAAILCITFGMVVGTGISQLQFANMNLTRNIFVVGFSLFMGLSVPQYFNEFATRAGHGPVNTDARWFNDILNVFFASPVVVALIVAVFLDSTLTRHVSKRDRGMLWTRKFRHFGNDPRNYEFYRLPVGLHKFFPPT
jgi:xanthine/uracil permease